MKRILLGLTFTSFLLLISCIPFDKIQIVEYFDEMRWTVSSDKFQLEIDLIEEDSHSFFTKLKIDDEEHNVSAYIDDIMYTNTIYVDIYIAPEDSAIRDEIKEINYDFNKNEILNISWDYEKGLKEFKFNEGKIHHNYFKTSLFKDDLKDLTLSYEKIDISNSKYEPYDYRRAYFENSKSTLYNPSFFNKTSYGHMLMDGKKEMIQILYFENNKFRINKIVNEEAIIDQNISGTYSFTYPNLKLTIESNSLTKETIEDINYTKYIGDKFGKSSEIQDYFDFVL